MIELTSAKTKIGNAGKKGRGVFATQAIASCEVVEKAPFLIIEGELLCNLIGETSLSEYVYDVSYTDEISEEDTEAIGIGLGHTSMYNTDDNKEPNAEFEIDIIKKTITISALREIRAGEEITIAYRDEEADRREQFIDICMQLATFKHENKKQLGPKFKDNVWKIQESLHEVAQEFLPRTDDDEDLCVEGFLR